MAVMRRFLLASSLARLLQREGGPADRLVEAYFPARSDRTQLVRVERDRASLILRTTTHDDQASEEAVEVPLSHAEALVEVAAGTVAFDRTVLPLGRGVEGVLDRFILPQGLDLLSVTLTGDPSTFAPPLWLGPEVTGDVAFEARELAISGLPTVEGIEVTNAALEALLDTLGSPGAYGAQAQPLQRVRQPHGPATAPGASGATMSDQRGAAPVPEGFSTTGEDEPRPHSAEAPASTAGETNSGAAPEELPSRPHEASPGAEEVEQSGSRADLPDVVDGPALEGAGPAVQRRPMLRANVTELDEGIARLARSLAPRKPRSER